MIFLKTFVTWLGYLFTLIGFTAAVYKSIQAWLNVKTIRWSDFDRISKKLLKKISLDDFYPDVIVTIGRGGAIVGAIISGNLMQKSSFEKKKLRNIPIIGTDRIYKWVNGQRVEIPNSSVDFSPLNKQKVLLVSADILSGRTMNFYYKSIEVVEPTIIKTACLVKGVTSTFIPDYYGKEIPADFKMPWMYTLCAKMTLDTFLH